MSNYRLVVCEKPSVAKSIAAVLEAKKREDGYLFGNGFIVSWCFGHLAELADADAYFRILQKVETCMLACTITTRTATSTAMVTPVTLQRRWNLIR